MRYSRQEIFTPIGRDGQARLKAARVAVVGCGALGSQLCETMVRAGVGLVRLIDRDIVEESNLQRQSLFTEADAQALRPKALAAKARLQVAAVDRAGLDRPGPEPVRALAAGEAGHAGNGGHLGYLRAG